MLEPLPLETVSSMLQILQKNIDLSSEKIE